MAGQNFIKYHWTRLEKGATIVVTLSTGANVRLMDGTNFNVYKNGRRHHFVGGLVKKPPFRITVPRAGNWYLTIDLMGLKATSVRHSATVEPPPLPTAKSAPRDRDRDQRRRGSNPPSRGALRRDNKPKLPC